MCVKSCCRRGTASSRFFSVDTGFFGGDDEDDEDDKDDEDDPAMYLDEEEDVAGAGMRRSRMVNPGNFA